MRRGKALHVALWIVQVLLAAFFVMVGYSHGLMPYDEIAEQAAWMKDVPHALGLAIIMLLAIGFHIVRGEASVIGLHTVAAALALFVAWGRLRDAGRGPLQIDVRK